MIIFIDFIIKLAHTHINTNKNNNNKLDYPFYYIWKNRRYWVDLRNWNENASEEMNKNIYKLNIYRERKLINYK